MRSHVKTAVFRLILFVVVTAIALTEFGCYSSRLTNVWKDPEFKNTAMTNMLVIAAKKNAINRRLWEDLIAGELASAGVTATPSYRLFADSIPNPDQVGTAVQEKKFDGVLFIRKLPTQVTTNYVPGPIKKEEVTQYNERTKTYTTFYHDIEQPGFTDTNKVVRHEVTVFTTHQGGQVVWSATGEMINPDSREEIRNEITDLIVPELAHQGIIPSK